MQIMNQHVMDITKRCSGQSIHNLLQAQEDLVMLGRYQLQPRWGGWRSSAWLFIGCPLERIIACITWRWST